MPRRIDTTAGGTPRPLESDASFKSFSFYGEDINDIVNLVGYRTFDQDTHSGLTFNHLGALNVRHDNMVQNVAAGGILLTANQTNYIELSITSPFAVTTNTTGFTKGKIPLYTAVTDASAITIVTDYRSCFSAGGGHIYGTAAPTSGSWLQGDYVYNSAPSELGGVGSKYIIRGWSCVSGGSPGAWVQDRGFTGN